MPRSSLRGLFVVILLKLFPGWSSSLCCRQTCNIFGVNEQDFYVDTTGEESCGEQAHAKRNTSTFPSSMLHLHNSFRDLTARGGASNMRVLSWDAKLEALSRQNLAFWLSQTCSLSPPECYWPSEIPNITMNYAVTGGFNKVPDLIAAFTEWTDPTIPTKLKNIISAQTSKLGCSDVVFVERDITARFFLCYYFPGGNDLSNEEPFLIGDSCSKCPFGTACLKSSIYPNLCAETNHSSDITNNVKPNVPSNRFYVVLFTCAVIMLSK